MIRWFEIEDVNKGAARFDFAKLEALNGLYMRQMDDAELLDTFDRARCPIWRTAQRSLTGWTSAARRSLLAAMPGLKERAKTLVELADGAAFLFAERPLAIDEKAAGAAWRAAETMLQGRAGRARRPSRATGRRLDGSGDPRLRRARNGLKLGAVAQPLRAALTGEAPRPACSTCSRCSAATKAWHASPIKSIRSMIAAVFSH